MRITLPKGCPQKIAAKVTIELSKYANGEIRPKQLWCRRDKVEVINIGYAYRAVCVNDSGIWDVVSHETYNKKYLKK